MRILHLAPVELWQDALATDAYVGSTRERTLAEEGFVHASTQAQLPGVLERFYADADLGAQVLLVVDVDACEAAGSPVVWEPAAPGADERFPHVHGPIPVTAVVATRTLGRAPDGTAELPSFDGLGVA